MKPKPWVVFYLLTGLLVLSFLPQPLLALDPPTSVRDGAERKNGEEEIGDRYYGLQAIPRRKFPTSRPKKV